MNETNLSGGFTDLAEQRQEQDTPISNEPSLQITSVNFSNIFSTEDCELIGENTIEELWMPIKVHGDSNLHQGFRQKLRGDVNGFPFEKIRDVTKAANDQIYNFDLLGIIDQDFPQIYKYTEDCYYDWHIDINILAPTRKITWIINLSDQKDYEGGDIEFLNTDTSEHNTNEKGKILIFPSFTPYKINKVTKGEKKIIIGHIHGALFK